MRIVTLHEPNNPSKEKYIDAEDFDAIEEYGSGSVIRLKSSDQPVAVHESSIEAIAIIRGDS